MSSQGTGFLNVHAIEEDDHEINNMYVDLARELPDVTKTHLRNKIKEFKKKWGCLPLSYFAHQKRIKNKTEKIILSYTIFDKYI